MESIQAQLLVDTSRFLTCPLQVLKEIDYHLFREDIKRSNTKEEPKPFVNLLLNEKLESQFDRLRVLTLDEGEDYFIIDVSLKRLRQVSDDQLFMKNPNLIPLLTRGLCILVDSKNFKQQILRRGLHKFFPISKKILNKNHPQSNRVPDDSNGKCRILTELMINPLNERIRSGQKIKIISTHKFNGENAQISYNFNLKKWVIGSKNVTLITADFSDLAVYAESARFSIASKIAMQFRSILSKMNSDLVERLKETLGKNKYVMLAEYCGDENYQHIIGYPKVELFFYTIVQNNSFENCLSPEIANQLFEEFGLSYQKPLKTVEVDSCPSLLDKLIDIVDEVNNQSCSIVGEGAVLYFVVAEKDSAIPEKVVQMAKVKSYEYIIFRKLRENLKQFLKDYDLDPSHKHYYQDYGFISDSQLQAQIAGQAHLGRLSKSSSAIPYKVQFDDFEGKVRSYKLILKPRSNEFYSMMARIAFQFANEVRDGSLIFENFVYFLNTLFHCCETCQMLTNNNYEKVLALNRRFIDWNQEFRKIDPHIKELSSKPLTILNSSANRIFDGRVKHVKIIMPVTILGSGKSFFFNHIHKTYTDLNFISYLISSDELSWYMVEKAKENTKGSQGIDYFNHSRKDYRSYYGSSFENLLYRLLYVNHGDFCMLIDKNHHPYHFKSIKKEYEALLESLLFTFDFVILYMNVEHPLNDHPLFVSGFTHPLNFKIFVDSFIRMQTRHNVLMSDYTEKQKLETLMLFFSFFCDYKPYTYRNSQNVFLTFYDESDSKLNELINEHLGPSITQFLEFQCHGKKVDSKGKNKDDYAEAFLAVWKPFYEKHKEILNSHVIPTFDKYTKSIRDYETIFFDRKVIIPFQSNFDFHKIHYFGIFPKPNFESEFVREKFSEFFSFISKMKKGRPEDIGTALDELKQISAHGFNSTEWKVPNHHLTVLFNNGQSIDQKDQVLIDGFENGRSVQLKICAFVYIPSRIGFFVVNPKKKRISENRIPHITVMTDRKYTPKDANAVAEILVQKKLLSDDFESSKMNFYSSKIKDLYVNHIVNDVYVFKFPDEVISATQRIVLMDSLRLN